MKFLYDPIKGFNAIPPPPGVRFTQDFGQNLLDYSPLKGHNGWDIAAPLGTTIYAACDGWIVEQTSKETGFGLRISQRVEINGQYFLLIYGHMQRLEIDRDVPYNWSDKSIPIKAGQVIGYVNSTGRSTGNHLHFGVYEYLANGQKKYPDNGYGGAVDPQQYALNIDPPEMQNIELVNSNGTFYLVANDKVLHGYGDMALVEPFLKAGIKPVDRIIPNAQEAITFDVGFYGHK